MVEPMKGRHGQVWSPNLWKRKHALEVTHVAPKGPGCLLLTAKPVHPWAQKGMRTDERTLITIGKDATQPH